jgi:hypothetical protein
MICSSQWLVEESTVGVCVEALKNLIKSAGVAIYDNSMIYSILLKQDYNSDQSTKSNNQS